MMKSKQYFRVILTLLHIVRVGKKAIVDLLTMSYCICSLTLPNEQHDIVPSQYFVCPVNKGTTLLIHTLRVVSLDWYKLHI